MSDTDLQLLARYTRQHAEDAFTEVVRRHLNLVYSAALRQVRSPQLAEEVAQSVFTDLARNARRLSPDTIVTAWLYQVTRRTAIDVVRSEARRQLREQIATEMNSMNATASDWTHIEPLLDDAMSALDETDRAAVLLRYFENKSLRQVGHQLGVSDDAAQKRVSRAVERLREFFSKRGVAVGTSGLVVVISAHAVQAAPVGLATTISTAAAALAGTSIAATATATATKAIAMTTLQKTLITAAVVGSVTTTLLVQRQDHAEAREVSESVQQQTRQLSELQTDNERLSSLATLASRPSPNNPDELQRLRTEAAGLRQKTNALATLTKDRWELQYALNKARQGSQDPNVQPTALSDEAKGKADYCGKLLQALWDYAAQHENQFPTSFEAAAAFVANRVGNDVRFKPDQFEIVYHGSTTALQKYANRGLIFLIREKQPWKNTDDKWTKIYATGVGFETISVADGDFEAFEKQHILAPETEKP